MVHILNEFSIFILIFPSLQLHNLISFTYKIKEWQNYLKKIHCILGKKFFKLIQQEN